MLKNIVSSSLSAALAEAATPYGIESFDDVLEPLWRGIRSLRGKVLAAFLKAIGHIIPLMDAEHAFYYTREVRVDAQSCHPLMEAVHITHSILFVSGLITSLRF